MTTKYDENVKAEVIVSNLHRLIGQIYKLLPYREEGIDWEKPLNTIQIELAGMGSLFADDKDFHIALLTLEEKLEGLLSDYCQNDFEKFRGNIFDCIGRVKVLQDLCH